MENVLSGKIYWIDDTFSYSGVLIPKLENASHSVAIVHHFTINNHEISFNVLPFKVNDVYMSYAVSLHKNQSGIKYNGKFKEETNADNMGAIVCELFENEQHYLIYGNWIEKGHQLTFWVIAHKPVV